MVRLIFILLLLTVGLAAALLPARQRRPNILWITCEDISPYLGAYGDQLVKTPNLDQLARAGVRYTRAFTTAGVCAPSRSTIITGMYATSIGTHQMRTIGDPKYQPVPSYSAVVPEDVRCFPEYLRKAGYYCTNNEKQDYQFIPPVSVWDENGPAASYRNRPAGKPFFAVFNFFITHESQIFGRTDALLLDSSKITVPPYYPDTKTVRHDMDRLFTNIERMDAQVGELIRQLKKDGLYDQTVIFFYSDHGGALPWMKREILERGTHIPLIVRFPGAKNAGDVNDDLVSAVDFAPTVLSLAGVRVPASMQGQAFLGPQAVKTPRKYVFAARDRMDTEYDRVRMVRDKTFRYLFNYMPEKPYYQNIEYRLNIPMMKEFLALRDAGKLDSNQAAWFKTKPVEELYDVQNDPHELRNLAADPAYQGKLSELRSAFQTWTRTVGDLGAVPEKEMIRRMWNGGDQPPATAAPEFMRTTAGCRIVCATKGASVGYRILKKGVRLEIPQRVVQSWDFSATARQVKNGDLRPAPAVWEAYNGGDITLSPGDTLRANAMRIGYKAATGEFVK